MHLGPRGEMELSEAELAELVATFLAEVADTLAEVDRQALALETGDDPAAPLAEIRRAVHTIKGDAGAVGYPRVAALAHRLEDALDAAREGDGQLAPAALTALLLDWTRLVRDLLESAEPPAGAAEAALEEAVARLTAALASRPPAAGAPVAPVAEAPPSAPGRGSGAPQPDAARKAETVRVDAARLEHAMALVGELAIARAEVGVALGPLAARHAREAETGHLGAALARLDRSLRELQKTVLGTRLVPVDVLFRRLPRAVREVALALGREVRLVTRGSDTELDKGLVDTLAEPLLHLARNAIDHGLEPPAARAAAGKPPAGRLSVAARHVGNQVVLEIEDDGRGIDRAAVGRRAVERGLVSAEALAAMGDAEQLELIFAPGLSTADAVTEVSGRGIGMDVVRRTVERLRGRVLVESTPGAGTRITLRLPLTLAIQKALLIRVGRERYALPLASVLEVLRVPAAGFETIEGAEVLRLREAVIPLLRLSRIAPGDDSGPTARRTRATVVIVTDGERRFGLVVEDLAGEEELVIKALDDRWAATPLASGAAVLGDGRAVLILDVAALAGRLARVAGWGR